VLLNNSRYCSWEPGHSPHAGALAVITVARLLRNSDANSVEKKRIRFREGSGGFYRELEKSAKQFLVIDFCGGCEVWVPCRVRERVLE